MVINNILLIYTKCSNITKTFRCTPLSRVLSKGLMQVLILLSSKCFLKVNIFVKAEDYAERLEHHPNVGHGS